MSVAAIVPARNAAHLLRECVDAILSQTVPPDEIVLSIGPSTDATKEVADAIVDPRVSVVSNPAGDRGSGINVALEATQADILAMVDAQSLLAADYLERALDVLAADPAVAVVGGPMRPEGGTAIGKAIALALQSPFGVGDSQFHFGGEARDAESVYLGVYRRLAFDRVGRYNPALLRTEDDDLNARIRDAGFRIRLDPTIRSRYRCRDSLPDLWRQYFGYGYWKVALAAIRPRALRLRHLVPAAFVLGSLVAGVVAVLGFPAPLAVIIGAYLLASAVFAARAAPEGLQVALLFPVVTATMHIAYGSGTLVALPRWRELGARAAASPAGPHDR